MIGTTTPRGGARERLLDTASRLFYSEGIHTVGIDRILEESGVAKASLYKTFGSKDALIAAYLEQRHDLQKARIARAMEGKESPRERILAVFEAQGRLFAEPGYRGCAFAAAMAEEPAGSATEERARTYRAYLRGIFRDLADEAGVADPDDLARKLHLIYDGAQQAVRSDRDPGIALASRGLAQTLLDAAGM